MKCLWTRSFIALILVFLCSCAKANQFIVLSDIHFNPFASCKKNSQDCPIVKELISQPTQQWESIFEKQGQKVLSQYSQDTNDQLFQYTLNEVKTKNQKAKFIMILGDFLTHHFMKKYAYYSNDNSLDGYQHFVDKTFEFITSQLKQRFPNTPIYPIIGNNDSYHGDYYNNPNGPFYHFLTTLWSPFFLNANNKQSFQNNFVQDGYYNISLDQEKHNRILVLNSVLFSQKAQGPNIDNAAQKEMDWLETQLQNASESGDHVMLVMHIPMGVDVYSTLGEDNKSPILFWKPNDNKEFLDLLKKYPVVTAILSGHTHMDGLKLIRNNFNDTLVDTSTPAISPAFNNNPGFKIYRYNRQNFILRDFTTYFLMLQTSITTWNTEYDFDKIYQPNCDQKYCRLIDGALAIQKTGPSADFYEHYYGVGGFADIPKSNWTYYWCGIQAQTGPEYTACLNKNGKVNKFVNHYPFRIPS